MSNIACQPRPIRRIPGLPFGYVEQGSDRSFNNLAVANVASVGSQLTAPLMYVAEIASMENLDISVCDNLNVVANNGHFVFGNDLDMTANNAVTITAPNVYVDGNLVINGSLDICNLECAAGNMTIDSNNVFFTGNADVAGNLNVSDTINACNISCPGNLNITSNTVFFSNNIDVNNTLKVCDIMCTGNLDINANNIVLNSNTLTITNFLNVLGDANVDGTLNANVLDVNNVTVNNNLDVLGNLNVCSITCPGGDLTINDNLVVNGNATVSNNLTSNNINVNNNASIMGTLDVCNIMCDNGAVNFLSNVIIQNLQVNGNFIIPSNGNLNVGNGTFVNVTVTNNTTTNNLVVNNNINTLRVIATNVNATNIQGTGIIATTLNAVNAGISGNASVGGNLTLTGGLLGISSTTSQQLLTRNPTTGQLVVSTGAQVPAGTSGGRPLQVEANGQVTLVDANDLGFLSLAFIGPNNAAMSAGVNVNTTVQYDLAQPGSGTPDLNYYPNGYIEFNTNAAYSGYSRTFSGAVICTLENPSPDSWFSVRLSNSANPNGAEIARTAGFTNNQTWASIPFIVSSAQAPGIVVTFRNNDGPSVNIANSGGSLDTNGIQNTIQVARISP